MGVRSEPESPRREVYEDLRPLLFSIAYRIVSSVSEAEDVVQEAFLRFHRAQSEGADIDSPRAWLSTVTTRLAINQVQSARARRETYRQIAVRARRQVEAKKPRFEASRRRREELARRFFDAIGDGDLEGLTSMLAADVVSYSDGGGKASAFPHPMHGRDRIARVLLQFGEWRAQLGAERMRLAEVNGQPGAVFLSQDGRAVLVVSLDIAEGLVQTIRAVSNPEKLRHLAPEGRSPLAR